MANQILKGIGEDCTGTAGLEASSDYTVVGTIGHENECFRVRRVLDMRRRQESSEGFAKPAVGPNLDIRMLNSLMQIGDKLIYCRTGWLAIADPDGCA